MTDLFSDTEFLKKIQELQANGMTLEEIGMLCERSGPTVGRWLKGDTDVGNMTVRAYVRVMGSVPLATPVPSSLPPEVGRLYNRAVTAIRQLAEKGYLRSLRAVVEMLSVLAKTD